MQHVFTAEQEECRSESITWDYVHYCDNRPTLDLLALRPVGIISLLDEESHFPQVCPQAGCPGGADPRLLVGSSSRSGDPCGGPICPQGCRESAGQPRGLSFKAHLRPPAGSLLDSALTPAPRQKDSSVTDQLDSSTCPKGLVRHQSPVCVPAGLPEAVLWGSAHREHGSSRGQMPPCSKS